MQIHTPSGIPFLATSQQSPQNTGQDFADSGKRINTSVLAGQLEVGDLVFIQVQALPFRKVAETTASWTNHVGIVIDTQHGPLIAESTFPLSKTTSLSRFVARSAHGRVVVRRLLNPLEARHHSAIRQAAQKRLGIIYDTGFNLHSHRQFCSRFVREVLAEATGYTIGQIERFSDFLAHNPDVDLRFWQLWYFGRIPWQRQTVSPASLLNCSSLRTIFDGYVENKAKFSSFVSPH